MSNGRKNKGSGAGNVDQPWFLNNVQRQRRKAKAAKLARKRQKQR
jgi:hypothetical protein